MSVELIKPKAVLLDVDGCLIPLAQTGELAYPSDNVTRIVRETAQIIPTGLATSRQMQKSLYMIRHLGLKGLSVLSGGAQIYDGSQEKIVMERTLDPDLTMAVAGTLNDHDIFFWIQDDGVDQPFDARYKPYKPFIIVANAVDDVTVKYLFDMVQERSNLLTAYRARAYPDGRSDVHITDPRTTKKDGILKVAELMRITPQEMLGIGDGPNDRVLVETCGIGIAMANAVPEVKAVASYIVPTAENDGVAIALKKFVLHEAT